MGTKVRIGPGNSVARAREQSGRSAAIEIGKTDRELKASPGEGGSL